jgi:hypothetical protein
MLRTQRQPFRDGFYDFTEMPGLCQHPRRKFVEYGFFKAYDEAACKK